jgi:WXXGXW repeat (2 copies)
MTRRSIVPLVLAAVIGGLVAGSGFVTPMHTSAQSVVIYAPGPPPPARVELQGTPPGAGWTWVAGHWAWRAGAWVWVRGHWSRVPGGYRAWVPGHWVHRANGWVWVDGHWRY